MKALTPIILILVSIAAFFFYIQPQLVVVQAKRAEAIQYDDIIVKAAELKDIRAQLSDKLNTFSPSDLDKLGKMIPEKVDIARLILDIDGVAARYAIQINDIKTTDVPVGEAAKAVDAKTVERPYKTSTISFTFQTSYEGMLQFAKDLEQSLRLVDVVGISLAQSTSQFPIYNYTMTLQTYWLNSKI